MTIKNLLVANRGEIAVRVLRGAADLGLSTTSVFSEEDARALHVRRADQSYALPGRGAAAYLNIESIIESARSGGCDSIHPGYGFLSESADLARACSSAGLIFVGPDAEVLEQLGDKAQARALAAECGVPVLLGTSAATSFEEAHSFYTEKCEGGALMVKAVSGGGGRGLRVVRDVSELAEAMERCSSEAMKAFGSGDVYVEEFLPRARHIEVQVLGDGESVVHLWERECTLQRRHQKLVEVAPSPNLPVGLRESLLAAALKMARATRYRSLGTFEFLVEAGDLESPRWAFIEANPRIQVEHTVTEAVTGVDLVQAQLEVAGGRTLDDLGLTADSIPAPRGHAVQVRVNMETMTKEGLPRPALGTIHVFDPPTGPGIRVDHHAYAGFEPPLVFDSLLAKVIAHTETGSYVDALSRVSRALRELQVEGAGTNAVFLEALVSHPDVLENRISTVFIEENAVDLVSRTVELEASRKKLDPVKTSSGVGAQVDSSDPLAVLTHGRQDRSLGEELEQKPFKAAGSEGGEILVSPVQGTVASIQTEPGLSLHEGEPLLVIEAMKMEHVIEAPFAGEVERFAVGVGATLSEGDPLLVMVRREVAGKQTQHEEVLDLDFIRPDLAEVQARHSFGLDENRSEAVAKRARWGQRTACVNVEDLCDEGSFVEYAPLVVAGQRRRRGLDDLRANTPRDGMVAGMGSINGHLHPDDKSRCVIMSYDYTVLAGTQGLFNHLKKDRLFDLAEKYKLPLVLLSEGGGGRPGDTDGVGSVGLNCRAFALFGRLSGLVPLVGINSGRCFAGNAALLGCCDVVIATANSNIGMGGPAMIEGGGLGVFRPDEVGPMEVQVANGVVDIAVEDEAEAISVAKKYISYFQGSVDKWTCEDQRHLRNAIPENRLRIYDVRQVINKMADTDSVLELRSGFGLGMVTALARFEGRPIGIVANNPVHLSGAIDREGADKASRFMQLCDAFDLPLLFLCDTPGIMVGPESEKTALVRHAARMFVTGASLSVPFFTIVLRKGYGLGAQAMAGGSFWAPFFTVAWPTGEFGGMGLEGAVKLGYRKDLEAIEDPEERLALYEKMVARMYEQGKAVNTASHFEIDGVIDPKDSRSWIMRALRSAPEKPLREGKKRPFVDTW
ncbi:MAG: carbamoyl-phosphate synthase large subunit [Deltaproteobacteria bacterium]|nr:carbamoyl-phosphate synthase large subunit [Deltaproteobacteria bacterium]